MRICIHNLGVFRPSFFWDITKPTLAVVYRLLHFECGADWLSRRVGNEFSTHIAAEVRNLIFWFIPFCLNYILQYV